jgi:hypothetical protein
MGKIKELVILSWSRWCVHVALIISAALITMINTPFSMAAQSTKKDYFFFPYRECLAFTIRNMRQGAGEQNGTVFITVVVNDVLRGRFKKNQTVTLILQDPNATKEFLPGEALSDGRGRRCLVAFDVSSVSTLDKNLVNVYHLYSPIGSRQYTQADILALESKLPPVFPYNYCLLVTIESAKLDSSNNGKDPELNFMAHIEESLFGEFSMAGAVGFACAASDANVLPNGPLSSMAGKRCVWMFQEQGLTESNLLYMQRFSSPFPNQKFSEADLERLREKMKSLNDESQRCKDALQSYLEHRWSIGRIRDFCRPETRYPPGEQNLVYYSGKTFEGQLYPEAEAEIGQVTWYANVYDGVPDGYSVNVRRGNSRWNLEISSPSLKQFSEDDFVKLRVARTLTSCLRNYDLTHPGIRSGKMYTHYRLWPSRGDDLIRDQGHRVFAYRHIFPDARILTVGLDKKLSISSIKIDGKDDELWNKAYAEANKNIDALHRSYLH